MAGDTPDGASVPRLELSVPCDERYGDLLRAVSRRMAAYIGYPETDAEAIAAAVVQASAGLLESNAPATYKSLDLAFTTRGREMEILVRYRRDQQREARGESEIRDRLCGGGASGAAVDALRRVMAGVEFGCRDGVEFCRLTKRLPHHPV